MSEASRTIGDTRRGGVLIVADHASARVPDDIALGIDPALLANHVAIDIGVAEVAERLCETPGFAAFLGNVSRLVCDFNREPQGPLIAPVASDGHAIPGNALDHVGHQARLQRFWHPYHDALAALIAAMDPVLIVSLHSFTPHLASRPEVLRPWHVGVLYNQDRRAAALAIAHLRRDPALVVGDQEPYSGVLLNATMNRHAEATGRRYFGVEIRQDLIAAAHGQAQWAMRLGPLAHAVAAAGSSQI